MACQYLLFQITLNALEGHSPVEGLFKLQFDKHVWRAQFQLTRCIARFLSDS